MSEKERYQQYLCSREWGLKRAAVRERCKGICERCQHLAMSHVHHLTYIRKYDERPEDLQGLCEGCHEFTHGLSQADPVLKAPIKLAVSGAAMNAVRWVYLAGKIDQDGDWRGSLVADEDDLDVNCGNHAFVAMKDGRRLWVTGPNFTDISAGDAKAQLLRKGDRVRVTVRTMDGWRGKGTVLMSQYRPDDVLMISPDDRPRGTLHACRHEVVPIRGKRSVAWVEDILYRLHTDD